MVGPPDAGEVRYVSRIRSDGIARGRAECARACRLFALGYALGFLDGLIVWLPFVLPGAA